MMCSLPPALPRTTRWAGLVLSVLAGLTLGACSGSGSGSEDTVTVNGDVPIAYVKRATSVGMNPTDGANSAPGGDLMLREKSSASAAEHNLTARFTQGQGDASDPEVSYDGKKIVFAMRCPTTNTSTIDGQPACTGRWNIWEYNMAGSSLTGGSFRRVSASSDADDVDPVYLPANRGIVFSSNRQAKSSRMQALGRAYFAADEYERERVMNLHSMAADGSNIQQISFNQSHERNPVIRPNGDIMFARWEHVADRNRFAVFRSKPDGTDMFVLYGAQSPGNSFLHPRDMDPRGRYAGQLVSTLMPLSGTQEGGSLMMVDAARYSENNTPASSSVPAQGGQSTAASDPLNPARQMSDGRGLSLAGRATTPYPLWDGTDRILVQRNRNCAQRLHRQHRGIQARPVGPDHHHVLAPAQPCLVQAGSQFCHQSSQCRPAVGLPDAIFFLAHGRRSGALGSMLEQQLGKCGLHLVLVSRLIQLFLRKAVA